MIVTEKQYNAFRKYCKRHNCQNCRFIELCDRKFKSFPPCYFVNYKHYLQTLKGGKLK